MSYRRDDNPGLDMLRGVQMFGGMMQQGQRLEQGRMEMEDEKGVNAAYEYIANKVGQTGDISVLDGDPIMNTRYGAMGAGKFLGQRAQNETSRLQMLKTMAASDDEYYRNTFRPMAFAAQEAFNAGDMQRFGSLANELSAKAPLPYKTELDADGNFKLLFRSNKAGGWTDTGRRLAPQEVMQEIGGIIGGEQTILAGMGMDERITSPRYLAAAARYRLGTIDSNAKALADPAQWIPMQKGNHIVWAVPQNSHTDYSTAPVYRIVDDSGKMGGMVGNLDGLLQNGWVRADAKAKLDKLRGAGGSAVGGTTPFKLSESDRKWIGELSTIEDLSGNKTVNPYVGMALETLMGNFGQSRYSAKMAFDTGIQQTMQQVMRESRGCRRKRPSALPNGITAISLCSRPMVGRASLNRLPHRAQGDRGKVRTN